MGSLGNGEFKKATMWLYPKFMGFNPSERWGHSACYSNGFLYIFGGCCGGLHFSDVLVLNLETMAWTNIATTGAGPGPRDSHSAVIVGHMMIIFGGTNGTKKVNDIHILDLLTREWTRPNCKGVAPTPRESHTATMISHDRMVIFGGSGEGDANYLNDLHVLDLKTMRWSSPVPKGDIPVPRDSHIAVFVCNNLFVYGGDCGDRYRGDVDVFNVDTLTWSRFVVQGESPGVRAGHAAVTIGTKVYMIGGVGDKQYYNDVWILDTITCSWTQLEVHGQQPQGRFSHTAIVTDSDIAIYGGCGEDERPLNELLILQLGSDHANDRYNNFGCTLLGSQCSKEKRHFLHEHQASMSQSLPFSSDPMHTKRRRMSSSKACELIESEPEEHSLSLSQHSSPSHSDQERTLVKIPSNSSPQVLPLFKNQNQNQISSSCKQFQGTLSNDITILSRTSQDPHFVQEQSNHYKNHQNNHASRVDHRNVEPLRVQNLIGAEVHGKVDGAFDSGYLMTATVNGRIFRGVLFPPGPEVVSRGAIRGHNRRSPTSHVSQRNLHINRAFIRHSNHAPEASHHHSYIQDRHVRLPSPRVRSIPALSLGREQPKVHNELQGVVLTLGGPGSCGHSGS
uniref:RING finger protein B-like n=1 Tax=Erigeron canadensis TaxID=72917 RepID=UPI001CB8AEEF|nr:RING finger protein B-like [Erigeron canadensis]